MPAPSLPPGLPLGARRATPLVVGTVAAGLVLGATARTAGLTLAETVAMSGLVYAGTAQLTVLGLWTDDPATLPLAGILLATFVVNLRNLMLGLSLAPTLVGAAARRVYGAGLLLTEDAWALMAAERTRRAETTGRGRPGPGFLVGAGAVLWLTWVASSAAGHAAGSAVGDPGRWALDFGGIAGILVLLPALWRGRGDLPPWAAAGVVALAAHRLLPGHWYILLGALTGILAAGSAPQPAEAAHDAR